MDIGKVLLVAVGGYVLYEWYQSQQVVPVNNAVAPTTASTTVTTTGNTQTVNATQSTQQVPTVQSTLQQIMSRMQAAGDDYTQNHTVWQWNYYYQAVSGIPGPDPAAIMPNSPSPDTQMISINQWWADMQSAGFSGLRGLGLVANMNPYVNYYTPGKGIILPTGAELKEVRM